MGIFGRLSKIFTVNLNDLLDRMENPEKGLRHILSTLEEAFQEARKRYVSAEGSRELLRLTLEQERRLSSQWLERAKEVLYAGEEALARRALIEKRKHDLVSEEIEKELASREENFKSLREGLAELERKVFDARRRLDALVARDRLARAQVSMSETIASLSGSDWPSNDFERMEEKVLQDESYARAGKMLEGTDFLGRLSTIEESFKELEDEEALKAEFEALKKSVSRGS